MPKLTQEQYAETKKSLDKLFSDANQSLSNDPEEMMREWWQSRSNDIYRAIQKIRYQQMRSTKRY